MALKYNAMYLEKEKEALKLSEQSGSQGEEQQLREKYEQLRSNYEAIKSDPESLRSKCEELQVIREHFVTVAAFTKYCSEQM